MWIAKIKIKHDCIIGNKCVKYNIATISVPFNLYMEKNTTYSPEFHTLWGNEKDIKKFTNALKRDNNVKNLEIDGNKVFLIEFTKHKIPVTIRAKMQQKIIWIKPIHINTKGEEFWEIASWEKKHITNFIKEIEKISDYTELAYVKQTKLKDIYYTKLLPNLTDKQKEAMMLAFEQGYYEWPKQTDFQVLAKKMKVSVATFREHLKKAEKKLLPELIEQIR